MRDEHHLRGAERDEARAIDDRFAADVNYYLSQDPRQLPSHYLYDALGSALFEAICELPWYRITRAEMGLLARSSRQIAAAGPFTTLVELGPGSGQKLLTLLESDDFRKAPVDVHLIDVSARALTIARETISAVDGIHVVTHQAPYEVGLAQATRERRRGGPALALFLGSNIGNFDPPGADAFLRGLRASLGRRDALLVGADLAKPAEELILAYDDPLGVTAAFNRNLLVRINRELRGNFDVNGFSHRAIWNDAESRVEMHLVSRWRQAVNVEASALAFTMEEGETIWTESSYKYEPEQIVTMLTESGFSLVEQWIDTDRRFALTLVEAA
jgi:L-histidine Nalpha-methyltransferase